MRNNRWLLKVTKRIWQEYFGDIPIKNNILVFFGRRNKMVLGSIKYNRQCKKTLIRINAHFQNKKIPAYVVKATLAHEIAHYAHGFSSPRRKMHRYPHQGGIIRKELVQRNLAALEKKSKKWLKNNWLNFLKNQK